MSLDDSFGFEKTVSKKNEEFVDCVVQIHCKDEKYGGVLISKYHVLTAQSCVMFCDEKGITVKTDETSDDKGKNYKVQKIHFHESDKTAYDENQSGLQHNIIILTLKTPVKGIKHFLSLPSVNINYGDLADFVFWVWEPKMTNRKKYVFSEVGSLHSKKFMISGEKKFIESDENERVLKHDEFLADDTEKTVHLGWGNSGGPLIKDKVLIGFSSECSEYRQNQKIFTNIFLYNEFINTVIKQDLFEMLEASKPMTKNLKKIWNGDIITRLLFRNVLPSIKM